jgi:collagen triple helix repeat protein
MPDPVAASRALDETMAGQAAPAAPKGMRFFWLIPLLIGLLVLSLAVSCLLWLANIHLSDQRATALKKSRQDNAALTIANQRVGQLVVQINDLTTQLAAAQAAGAPLADRQAILSQLDSVRKQLVDAAKPVEGAAGPPGPAGLNGLNGSPGKDGETGPVGAAGRDGTDGAAGAPGRNGADGAPGPAGPPGPEGPQGPPGQDATTTTTGPPTTTTSSSSTTTTTGPGQGNGPPVVLPGGHR